LVWQNEKVRERGMAKQSRPKLAVMLLLLMPFLALCLGYLTLKVAAHARDSGSDSLTVTASVGAPSSNPVLVPVGSPSDILLQATASNVPLSGTFAWSWTGTVEYASTPGNWESPPSDASYSISVGSSVSPTSNSINVPETVTFHKAGYWRITNIQATVVYTDSNNDTWTASGTAPDINFTVLKVSFLYFRRFCEGFWSTSARKPWFFPGIRCLVKFRIIDSKAFFEVNNQGESHKSLSHWTLLLAKSAKGQVTDQGPWLILDSGLPSLGRQPCHQGSR